MSKLKYWNGSQWVQVAPSLNEFGTLSNLTTTDKSSLVNATNEVKNEVVSHKADDTQHLSVMTNQGDLIYRGVSAPVRLAKGSAGQVLKMNSGATAPEWGAVSVSPPMCKIIHSVQQSIDNGSNTTLVFDSESFDTDNMHDNTTNNPRITFKTAGKYLVIANARFVSNGTGGRQIAIALNASFLPLAMTSQSAANMGSGEYNMGLSVSVIHDFAVNDFVQMQALQTSGGSLNILAGQYNTTFSALRVG